MNMKIPLIFDIKRGSLDDGDGIRTVVFFKGCPLDCSWCHNPESKSGGFDYLYDESLCQHCGNCHDFCPTGALRLIGRRYRMDELMSIIKADLTYYRISGGGVTLSGGEPTLHMAYSGALAKKLHTKGVSCALETCGYFDFSAFSRLVLPYLDSVLYDIKLLDPQKHREYTGKDNRLILENLRLLRKEKVRVIPRTPLIPGITDTAENLSGIRELLRGLGWEDRHVTLPYNHAKPKIRFPQAADVYQHARAR